MVEMGPNAPDLYGTVTVGERGQVVIPQAAREQLGISGGDKLLVLRGFGGAPGLFFIKTEIASEILSHAIRHLSDIEELLDDSGAETKEKPDTEKPAGDSDPG